MTDKRKLRISSAALFAVLLIVFVVPFGESGRIIAAFLLLPAAVALFLIIKKRPILSMHKRQILLIMTAMALVYLMLLFFSGIYFGFYRTLYKLNLTNFLSLILPVAVIVATTEVIRFVVVAQNDKLSTTLCYLSCVVSEMLVCASIPAVNSFNTFMDLVAGAFFPALIFNLLYNYLSKRYGIYPNLVFRLLTALYVYIIPYESAISDSLHNFIRLLLPIAIYLFIDSLYEKKRRYALVKKSKFGAVITVLAITIMVSVIMLISNQFRFGAYVIATDSMTGELNKGDTAIYERYDDQLIKVGQVIAFESDNIVVVHRVVEIKIINEETRYYTKGDANEDIDTGYITDSDIVGLVNLKVPYIGYPTLWVRSLFKR